MTNEEIYEAWAPPNATWSRWVKPALFAHINAGSIFLPRETPLNSSGDLSWVPPSTGSNAIIVDLPGADSVLFGLSLAEHGYRPVPLFNSIPGPSMNLGSGAVVEMNQVISLLIQGADQLARTPLLANAPPAFLLDSRRRGLSVSLMPQMFDNRSISLPTDFPSSNFLLSAGIQRVLVIQTHSNQPQPDLCHTLRRWQEAGIKIFIDSVADPVAPVPIVINRPPWFRHIWYGLLARFGLRRNPLGGFGGFIPEPSSSAG